MEDLLDVRKIMESLDFRLALKHFDTESNKELDPEIRAAFFYGKGALNAINTLKNEYLEGDY